MGYHKEPAARSANMGYTVVSCPNWHCYFDYTQQLEDDPFNYFIPKKRWLPLEAVYRFDPFEGVEAACRANVVGGQCCNWTEKTANLTELEWKMWPRGLALAEVLWTNSDPAKRDFGEFSARAAEHRRRLVREHVNCAPLK
jgi:hexosaminidase